MSNRIDDMRQYLLSLDILPEDKRYTMSFYKKTAYLNGLRQYLANNFNEHVSMGYGNVNSKICLVVNNEKSFTVIKSLIQDVFEKFGINFWNIYVTFVDKIESHCNEKYELLINEINAIKPSLLYVVDTDDSSFKEIEKCFISLNIPAPQRMFFIDIKKLGSSEEDTRKELWDVFKYLINYKEIGG